MSANRFISEATQYQVKQRANFLCEYCHASEQWQYVSFTVDHVIPISKHGANSINNLALACFHCNRQKSDKVKAFDAQTLSEVPLFNPRTDNWQEHFIWSTDTLSVIGLTPTGRATVAALAFNRARIMNIRAADRAIGRHPPPNDPIKN
ncbi:MULTISPECIES: HNH endonuclease [unclassified Nodularia (in: cyanobacteria)]|uniref:HNH endonuclease n=1 Tax=unclassified Nodularia (in: cyanobacteria) TaxID=2656917 RepID=UPI0018823EC3|nr:MULTISPECIES: HNH endonuclease [unclassified Nodularia (in: cyanobacteria)]MBE9199554.1 HNH endonuclease [Nodularia sp. LEGE 06071]MCC2691367.1 HNH endonuclease [Nodularia sp. LEGE 04288]